MSLKEVALQCLPPVLVNMAVKSRIPNLAGDRDIEWSWIASQMPDGKGDALDFGAGYSNLGLMAVQRGYRVISIDLTKVKWNYTHRYLSFLQFDLFKLSFPEKHFNLIINCSTIEHVGLSGRYGVTEEKTDGDLLAMKRLHRWMGEQAVMLLAIPVGKDAIFKPMTRIYGEKRLPELLHGFTVKKEQYWTKNNRNEWAITNKQEALNYEAKAGSHNPLNNIYGIGCFVLGG